MVKKKTRNAKLMLWRERKNYILVDANKTLEQLVQNQSVHGRHVYIGSVGFKDPDTKQFVDIAVFKNNKSGDLTFHNAGMISWMDQFQEEVKRSHRPLRK